MPFTCMVSNTLLLVCPSSLKRHVFKSHGIADSACAVAAGVRLSVFSQAKSALESSSLAHHDAVLQWQQEQSQGPGSARKQQKQSWWQRRRQRHTSAADGMQINRASDENAHEMRNVRAAPELWHASSALQRQI